jgi:hypothetical protein
LGPSFKLKDLQLTNRTDVAPVRSPRARAARDRAHAWSVRSSRMPDPISRSAIPAGRRGSPSPAGSRSETLGATRPGPLPAGARPRLERTAQRPPRRDAVRRDTVPALNTHHTMQVARRHSKVVNTVRLRASCLMLHASTVTIGSCPILSRSPGAEPRDFVFDGFWEWLSFIEHGGERGCDCVARTTILDGSMSRWLH